MPRISRQRSDSDVYHVFARGINRQAIFVEDDDYSRFISIVAKAKAKSRFTLFGYCLLTNHVHLLLKVGDDDIGETIKRITTGYACWFNWKYERVGHLFQDRFGSEPVETDDYLLAALRYIHKNPIKAGLCYRAEDYTWSSYCDYLGADHGYTDTAFVKSLADSYSKNWRQWFIDFTNSNNNDSFIDYELKPKPSDGLLRERIHELYGFRHSAGIGDLEKQARDNAIRSLKDEGFGMRQIARIVEIPYGVVRGC